MNMVYSDKLVRVALTEFGILAERNGVYRMLQQRVNFVDLAANPQAHSALQREWDRGGAFISEADVHRLLRQCERHLHDPHRIALGAFGVTIDASEKARDAEAKAGGNVAAQATGPSTGPGPETCYTRVGKLPNPAELFMKAFKWQHFFTNGGVAGIRSIEPVRALIEGKIVILPPWNIHEPEFLFYVTPCGKPVFFGLGLDMSDRRDEGISPLLLLKAKIFWHCAGLSQWLTCPENPYEFWKTLALQSWVERNGMREWPAPDRADSMTTDQYRRSLEELCADLVMCEFVADGEPTAAMGGTGIVPPPGDTFSLLPGDSIKVYSKLLGPLCAGTAVVPKPRRELWVPGQP